MGSHGTDRADFFVGMIRVEYSSRQVSDSLAEPSSPTLQEKTKDQVYRNIVRGQHVITIAGTQITKG